MGEGGGRGGPARLAGGSPTSQKNIYIIKNYLGDGIGAIPGKPLLIESEAFWICHDCNVMK